MAHIFDNPNEVKTIRFSGDMIVECVNVYTNQAVAECSLGGVRRMYPSSEGYRVSIVANTIIVTRLNWWKIAS